MASPYTIEILLKYFYQGKEPASDGTLAFPTAINQLIDAGMLKAADSKGRTYMITNAGSAYIMRLTSEPFINDASDNAGGPPRPNNAD